MNRNVSLIESIFQSTVKNVLKDLPGCCATSMTSWFQGKQFKRNPSGKPSSCISDYKLTLCTKVLDVI